MNTVLVRDQNGNVDVMVRIPKFKLSDVIDGASDTVHPAFIVGGKEKEMLRLFSKLGVVEQSRVIIYADELANKQQEETQ